MIKRLEDLPHKNCHCERFIYLFFKMILQRHPARKKIVFFNVKNDILILQLLFYEMWQYTEFDEFFFFCLNSYCIKTLINNSVLFMVLINAEINTVQQINDFASAFKSYCEKKNNWHAKMLKAPSISSLWHILFFGGRGDFWTHTLHVWKVFLLGTSWQPFCCSNIALIWGAGMVIAAIVNKSMWKDDAFVITPECTAKKPNNGCISTWWKQLAQSRQEGG